MKKHKIKLPVKIFLIVCTAILLVNIVALFVSNASQDFANWWWMHVAKVNDGAMFLIFQRIPISYMIIVAIVAVFGVICAIWPKKGDNLAAILIGVAVLGAILPVVNSYQGTTTSKLNSLYFSGRETAEYTADDLYNLALYFRKQTKNLSGKALRADSNNNLQNLTKLAAENLKNASKNFDFLSGAMVDEVEFGEFDYTGQTLPYRASVSSDYPDGELLNTITHELCHTKGIVREDEATFCAIMAGIWSNDDFAKYVGYAEALRMSGFALKMMDYDSHRIDDLYGAFQGKCSSRSEDCASIYLNVYDLDDYEVTDWDDFGGYVDQLAPFSQKSDLGQVVFNRKRFDGEYDYTRCVRLLLEYFDLNKE